MARVALVTGAGSGLGEAIAIRLAEDGDLVIVNDIDADGAARTADKVGGHATVFDVTDSAAFDAAVDQVVTDHGSIDVLVNNAGILLHRPDVTERVVASMVAQMEGGEAIPPESLTSLSDDQFDRTMKVHVYGTFYGMRAALRHMQVARAGAIVNLASIYGLNPGPLVPEYAAAKGAIVQLTTSAAVEVAPFGIRVNAVAPGFVETPLLSPFGELFADVIVQRTPVGRMAQPPEVAEMVAYLASEKASFCVGEIMTITGGAVG